MGVGYSTENDPALIPRKYYLCSFDVFSSEFLLNSILESLFHCYWVFLFFPFNTCLFSFFCLFLSLIVYALVCNCFVVFQYTVSIDGSVTLTLFSIVRPQNGGMDCEGESIGHWRICSPQVLQDYIT